MQRANEFITKFTLPLYVCVCVECLKKTKEPLEKPKSLKCKTTICIMCVCVCEFVVKENSKYSL